MRFWKEGKITSTQSIEMRFQLLLLVLTSLVAFGTAVLENKPKRLRVTAENQWELSLPIGTQLVLDKRTQLYRPPPISDNFTVDDRYYIMWHNQDSYQNYCKEGPSVEGSRMLYNFWWHQWCKNSSGHDICCRGHKCSCNMLNANCACLTPEGYEYWERKKEVDWKNVKRIWETVKNFNVIYLMYKNWGKKTDDDSNEDSKEASKQDD